MHLTRKLLVALLVSSLGGCSTLHTDMPAPEPLSEQERAHHWQQHQTRLSALKHWEISGKLGIRTPDRSSSVYLNWQQNGAFYNIRIASVIGQSLALLQGSATGVALSTADHETLYAASPERLLQQELGWVFPVSDLQYWIKGVPAPGNSQPLLNDHGLLKELQQGGWSLSFSRYQQVGNFQLPGRLVAQGPHARLTFIINDWAPAS